MLIPTVYAVPPNARAFPVYWNVWSISSQSVALQGYRIRSTSQYGYLLQEPTSKLGVQALQPVHPLHASPYFYALPSLCCPFLAFFFFWWLLRMTRQHDEDTTDAMSALKWLLWLQLTTS
ncbi:hypothetical protein B0H14DRAFT_3443998 [Mycena olivaceomarginata]|nr:hypothetical protein B0H14DRAFT_3443998 [Mycena olivaceomarginata]